MRQRLAGLVLPVLGVALAGALLFAEPSRDALVAQGFTRALERERASPSADSLFGRLAAETPLAAAVRLELVREPDARRVDADPALRRAFASALHVHNAERGQRLELAPAGAPGMGATGERLVRVVLTDRGEALHWSWSIGREEARTAGEPWPLPSRHSLVPPLLAIGAALLLRRVILALFLGIWSGAVLALLAEGATLWTALPLGLWNVFAVYWVRELFDTFRVEIIGFTLALISMVGVMSRGGGVRGMVDAFARFARSARSTLAVTFAAGLAMFFDDYSNCLVVGNSMRPLTDRLRVSREKLAYVVDSTAAPVAGLSLVSTWIAFEVSLFAAQLPAVGIAENGYAIFLQTLPYRFYCLFTLGFVGLVVLMGRDFGPMLAAERRARRGAGLVRPGGRPLVSTRLTGLEPSPDVAPRLRNALLPVATVVVLALEEIFRQGGGFVLLADDPGRLATLAGLTEVLFQGSGGSPLLIAACGGLLVVALLVGSNALRIALAGGALCALAFGPALAEWTADLVRADLRAYLAVPLCFAAGAFPVGALVRGRVPTRRGFLDATAIGRAAGASTRSLGLALVILFEAWMIGSLCGDLGTADYLVALTSGVVAPLWLPALLFVAAALVSFSTGTSWGTMSILLPNVVALAAAVGADSPLGSTGMVIVCIGAVLDGSIFGDHCSPISDTTVLSSVASACDHVDHVRTQLPYALAVAAVALGVGYLGRTAFAAWSFPLAALVAASLLGGLLLVAGRRPEVDYSGSSTSR